MQIKNNRAAIHWLKQKRNNEQNGREKDMRIEALLESSPQCISKLLNNTNKPIRY